jgi:hypothetical protein
VDAWAEGIVSRSIIERTFSPWPVCCDYALWLRPISVNLNAMSSIAIAVGIGIGVATAFDFVVAVSAGERRRAQLAIPNQVASMPTQVNALMPHRSHHPPNVMLDRNTRGSVTLH